MIFVTMKAHVRSSGKPVLILGMDASKAVTIDPDGNLRGYRLYQLKATALEAMLRFDIDTKGVEGMLAAVTSDDGDDLAFEIGK